jgi:D-glycero-D-manno-heptose 1,7-bisphosphate phosphatase
MKVAFLDRDGTIISDYPDELWPHASTPEFLAGAIEALQAFQRKGYQLIIVTNQYLIGEGFISLAQYAAFSGSMLEVLAEQGVQILDIFHCPHRRDHDCARVKPRPGLVQAALAKYPSIDLRQSFLVGDSPSDIELAEAVGLRAFSMGFESKRDGVTKVTSLSDVVAFV